MFSWTVQAEAEGVGKSQDIWALWADVAGWPKWDSELEWSSIQGSFETGAEGILKPKGWVSSKFFISDMEYGKRFETKSTMPMTVLRFDHVVTQIGNKVRIVHTAKISGLLAPLLWLTLRGQLKRGLPSAVHNLAIMAEAQ